jgi:hypothetical protein
VEAPAPVGEVTIDVADAPPGLVVVVDGQEVTLPLRWPKDHRLRRVTFQAPDFEARTLSIPAGEDRTLRLGLRSVHLQPGEQPAPAPQEGDTPAPGLPQAKPASQPPPLMDI